MEWQENDAVFHPSLRKRPPGHRISTAVFVGMVCVLAACVDDRPLDFDFDLTCAASSASTPELTVLMRLSERGRPLDAAEVSLSAGEESFRFVMEPGATVGLSTFAMSVPIGGTVNGVATSGERLARSTCVVAAGLPEIQPAARAVPGGARVSWLPVQGAALYRLAALDFATGETLASADASTSPATLAFEARAGHVVVIDVTADALTSSDPLLLEPLPEPRRSHRQVLLTEGADGGSAQPWQLFGPGDFVDDVLEIHYPRLASGEQVAVLLVNGGGPELGFDDAPAAIVEVIGSESSTTAGATDAVLSGAPDDQPKILKDLPYHDDWPGIPKSLVKLPPTPAPQIGDRKDLCAFQMSLGSSAQFQRISATVQHRSAHAAFWVDDRVQAGFDQALAQAETNLWQDLEAAYELHVLPALHTHFGLESDVNQDGVMSLLFTDLGPRTEKGFVAGAFASRDIYYPADTTPDCNSEGPNRGSNGFDLLYLRDLASYAREGGSNLTPEHVVRESYPNIMAHELQHDINFHQRWLRSPQAANVVHEDRWLNEALAQLAEDVAGYGLHRAPARRQVRDYLRQYPAFSMTAWEADPDGNYGGAHAFLRYFADRLGPDLTQRLEASPLTGKANFGAASGLPFELALAHFATASVFSNESFSPDPIFDYQGADWTPWHEMTGAATYAPIASGNPLTVQALRADGWRTLVTSPGRDGPATITVRAVAAQTFHVVAVKFAGQLR